MSNNSAFPYTESNEHPDAAGYTTYPGMTLRDYFAAKAMQSILAACYSRPELMTETIGKDSYERIMAQEAFNWADAMLTERNKQP